MLHSCCIPLYAGIIKGIIWQYEYTNVYNVNHHADFFSKERWYGHGIPMWHADVLGRLSYFFQLKTS